MGATHPSYRGKGRALSLDPAQPTDEELNMIAGVTAAATLAFLDLYLKDEAAARAYLHSAALTAFSGGKATVERR